MRRAVISIIVVVALSAGAAGLHHWWTVSRFVESTDDAYVQGDISVISPKIEGYVREIRVRDNVAVKAGDTLVVIDDRDFAAKLDQAEASLAAETATLATIDSQLALQNSLIDGAAATLAGAEAEQRRAQLDLHRYQSLAQGDVASRQRVETAQADAQKAEASVAGARAALAASRNQLGVLSAQRRQQQARIAQAEATRALARNDLDNTVIRSPVDGVVGNKGVQLGQYVKAGTQLLAVVPLPEIYVTANFKETQLTHMAVGQAVEIAVDAYPDSPIVGRLDSVSPGSGSQWSILPPENATGNFTKIVQRVPVRIAVPADNRLAGRLRPGLSVVVSVDTRDAASSASLGSGPIGSAWGAVPAPAAAAP
jgi:membrane fusion protein (multidrug efflux system)